LTGPELGNGDAMETTRQKQLEHAVRSLLDELGEQTATEFLIAVASERTQADPREIIEAVSAVDGQKENASVNCSPLKVPPPATKA
jgi:hypothetical protein